MQADGEAGDPPISFDDLDEFTQAYIEALFFTDNAPGVHLDEWQTPGFEPSEGNFPRQLGFSDLAADALENIRADCNVFQRHAFILLHHAQERGYTLAQAGRDFWLTRNGHGAGFWDRDALRFTLSLDKESVGDKLSNVARWFGEVATGVDDAGLVYH
jgi:hypothetical protein